MSVHKTSVLFLYMAPPLVNIFRPLSSGEFFQGVIREIKFQQ
jgi:hypothetical protein